MTLNPKTLEGLLIVAVGLVLMGMNSRFEPSHPFAPLSLLGALGNIQGTMGGLIYSCFCGVYYGGLAGLAVRYFRGVWFVS